MAAQSWRNRRNVMRILRQSRDACAAPGSSKLLPIPAFVLGQHQEGVMQGLPFHGEGAYSLHLCLACRLVCVASRLLFEILHRLSK